MKKHISKIMLIFSIIFFVIAIIPFVYYVGSDYSLDYNEQIRLILQFIASGVFLGLYRIIDLLERQ